MAKVNLYISNDAYEKINAIIEKRRQEGAREKDVSFSATASMLLELGLRVYESLYILKMRLKCSRKLNVISL